MRKGFKTKYLGKRWRWLPAMPDVRTEPTKKRYTRCKISHEWRAIQQICDRHSWLVFRTVHSQTCLGRQKNEIRTLIVQVHPRSRHCRAGKLHSLRLRCAQLEPIEQTKASRTTQPTSRDYIDQQHELWDTVARQLRRKWWSRLGENLMTRKAFKTIRTTENYYQTDKPQKIYGK